MNGALNLHPKVAASLLASWVTILIVYALHQWAHVDLPAEVGAAITGVVAFAAGWLAPSAVTTDPVPGEAAKP
jgi:uncharacterized membrane protein YfcA